MSSSPARKLKRRNLAQSKREAITSAVNSANSQFQALMQQQMATYRLVVEQFFGQQVPEELLEVVAGSINGASERASHGDKPLVWADVEKIIIETVQDFKAASAEPAVEE